MLTSCFHLYKGPGRINTARRAPRGDSGYRNYAKLAPGPWFMSVSPREYIDRYFKEVLGALDPKATWDELHKLVAPHEPVLLCWERPPFSVRERWWEEASAEDDPLNFSNWCHRRIVASWFEKELRVTVDEWSENKHGASPTLF